MNAWSQFTIGLNLSSDCLIYEHLDTCLLIGTFPVRPQNVSAHEGRSDFTLASGGRVVNNLCSVSQ